MIIVLRGYNVIIDDEDYGRVSKYSWMPRTNAHYGHPESVYFSYHAGLKGRIMLHRFLVGKSINDGGIVDHINGNTLDNRKCNLRIVTKSQNNQNRSRNIKSTTGYKGVDYHKASGKYRVRICVNHKSISIGYFRDIEKAHAAYCEASKKYHGEYGRTE